MFIVSPLAGAVVAIVSPLAVAVVAIMCRFGSFHLLEKPLIKSSLLHSEP